MQISHPLTLDVIFAKRHKTNQAKQIKNKQTKAITKSKVNQAPHNQIKQGKQSNKRKHKHQSQTFIMCMCADEMVI